jgi:hypothetical protein
MGLILCTPLDGANIMHTTGWGKPFALVVVWWGGGWRRESCVRHTGPVLCEEVVRLLTATKLTNCCADMAKLEKEERICRRLKHPNIGNQNSLMADV